VVFKLAVKVFRFVHKFCGFRKSELHKAPPKLDFGFVQKWNYFSLRII